MIPTDIKDRLKELCVWDYAVLLIVYLVMLGLVCLFLSNRSRELQKMRTTDGGGKITNECRHAVD